MLLSACWLALEAFAAARSSSRCCSFKFGFSLIARSSASALFASWPSSPLFSNESLSDCCFSASASSDLAILANASFAAAFSASLISPDSSFFPSSPSSFFAAPKSPAASDSVSCESSPDCDSSPCKSRLSASLVRAGSLFFTSSSFFCNSLMRRIASRRLSTLSGASGSASPPIFASAFCASVVSALRTAGGSVFELSSPSLSRSIAASDAASNTFAGVFATSCAPSPSPRFQG